MAYLYDPHVTELKVSISVKIAHGGEQTRELTFTEEHNGRDLVNQLTDTLLSACDLATCRVKP